MIEEREVVEKIQEAVDASRKYYYMGSPVMSDSEFDSLIELLRHYSLSFPHLFTEGTLGWKVLEGDVTLGADFDGNAPVVHPQPMLSLRKASTRKDLENFLSSMSGVAQGFSIQPKIDGLAVSVLYRDGLPSVCATRGDGRKGENITHILTAFTIHGLPQTLNVSGDVWVRGELFFTFDEFNSVSARKEKHDGKPFSIPRNALAGCVKASRDNPGVYGGVECHFASYRAVSASGKHITVPSQGGLTETSLMLSEYGFNVSPLKSFSEVNDEIERFNVLRSSLPYPVDGVVIKPVNDVELLNSLEPTLHHPVSQVAWKYPAEGVITTVERVEPTVGRTGKVTPLVHVQKVNIDGSVVTKMSAHNYEQVLSLHVGRGAVVRVVKANEIIPQIQEVIIEGEQVTPPSTCVECGCNLVGDLRNLSCVNSSCGARVRAHIEWAFSRSALNVEGVSTGVVKALVDSGVRHFLDVYDWNVSQLSSLQLTSDSGGVVTLGVKRAESIHRELQKSLLSPLSAFIVACGIPGLGVKGSERLTECNPTVSHLLEPESVITGRTVGVRASLMPSVCEWLKAHEKVLSRWELLTSSAVKVEVERQEVLSVPLNGLSVSVSGGVPHVFQNRSQFERWVKDNGGVFHSTPKTGTSVFVWDGVKESRKSVKAQQVGCRVVHPDVFMDYVQSLVVA